MTVRCFPAVGAIGVKAGGTADPASRFGSERLIVPLGLIRPVPRTSPPAPFWRMVPVVRLTCRGGFDRVGLVSSKREKKVSGGERARKEGGQTGGSWRGWRRGGYRGGI